MRCFEKLSSCLRLRAQHVFYIRALPIVLRFVINVITMKNLLQLPITKAYILPFTILDKTLFNYVKEIQFKIRKDE